MLRILQTTTAAPRLGLILLLALAVLTPAPAATTLRTLYSFTGVVDGAFPEAGVVLGSGGTLFGTTSGGAFGWGGVYELVPNGTGGWNEVTLYSFTGTNGDGAVPMADLRIGKNSVLYGTTFYGGAYGYGTVFQLAPGTGGTWTERVLYNFKGGNDGANPAAGLALASTTGVLYGTTYNGGTSGLGTVFQLAPGAGGIWSERVLHSFLGGSDGANPVSDLVIGSGSILFGTTSQGGSVTNSSGTFTNWGVVFQVAPQGGGVWSETVLYTFSGGSDGGSPESALIIGANKVLYGSTFWGGSPTVCPVGGYPQGCGTIFQLVPPSGSGTWTETVLHTFTGVTPDGSHPYKNLALNVSGVLFGTTYAGGAQTNYCFPQSYTGCGTIFSVKPPATPGGSWTKSNVAVFQGSNGGAPNGLLLGPGGTFYGTTVLGGSSNGTGTVFSLGQ